MPLLVWWRCCRFMDEADAVVTIRAWLDLRIIELDRISIGAKGCCNLLLLWVGVGDAILLLLLMGDEQSWCWCWWDIEFCWCCCVSLPSNNDDVDKLISPISLPLLREPLPTIGNSILLFNNRRCTILVAFLWFNGCGTDCGGCGCSGCSGARNMLSIRSLSRSISFWPSSFSWRHWRASFCHSFRSCVKFAIIWSRVCIFSASTSTRFFRRSFSWTSNVCRLEMSSRSMVSSATSCSSCSTDSWRYMFCRDSSTSQPWRINSSLMLIPLSNMVVRDVMN